MKSSTTIEVQLKETTQWSRDFPPLPAPAPDDWKKFMVKQRVGPDWDFPLPPAPDDS